MLSQDDWTHGWRVWPERGPASNAKSQPTEQFLTASDGFFAAMGIPVVAGRTFGALDQPMQQYEAVVNRATTRERWQDSTGAPVHWPAADA
jgi:hypothetical protein